LAHCHVRPQQVAPAWGSRRRFGCRTGLDLVAARKRFASTDFHSKRGALSPCAGCRTGIGSEHQIHCCTGDRITVRQPAAAALSAALIRRCGERVGCRCAHLRGVGVPGCRIAGDTRQGNTTGRPGSPQFAEATCRPGADSTFGAGGDPGGGCATDCGGGADSAATGRRTANRRAAKPSRPGTGKPSDRHAAITPSPGGTATRTTRTAPQSPSAPDQGARAHTRPPRPSAGPGRAGPSATAVERGAATAIAGQWHGQPINESAWVRRSLPEGVLGMVPGASTTTFRGRTSTSATTSWATSCSIRRTSVGS
jgi:hypothetical protein